MQLTHKEFLQQYVLAIPSADAATAEATVAAANAAYTAILAVTCAREIKVANAMYSAVWGKS